MIVSVIAAMAQNKVIGKDGKMPWNIPAEMKYFKETTTGSAVIMGRKTFDSIGKPLSNRMNIVITRDKEWDRPGVHVVRSIEDALFVAATHESGKVFVIGGSSIYKQFLDDALVDFVYLTVIQKDYEGDATFPTEYLHNSKICSLIRDQDVGLGMEFRIYDL